MDTEESDDTSLLVNASEDERIIRQSSVNSRTSNLSVEEINYTKKRTIKVLNFTMFIGSISFSIVMSSLWPFLRTLDNNVNETFLGWVNAGYSLAQMISAFTMGYWSEKRRPLEPIITGIVCLAVGSGLYSYAGAFGAHGIWMILAARCILGFGAGTVSVARAVCAQLSEKEERAKVMAQLAVCQSIGFFIGPAIQALGKPIGTDGLYYAPLKLYFNIYTAPGFFMIILAIINILVVMFFYVDDVDDSKSRFRKHVKKLRRQSTSFEPIDSRMMLVCTVLWFAAMTVFSLNETIISPLVMNEFAWTRNETVFYTSIILSVAGVIAIITFLVVAPLAKRFGDRAIVLSGYLLMLVGFIVYLPWGPGYPKLTMIGLANTTTAVNSTDHIMSSSKDVGGGCPYQYKWCHTTPSLPFGQFLVAATLVGIGYPAAAVIINTIYSKLLGPFPQGKYMGMYSAVGSFARVIGPLYVTAIYQHFGLRWTSASVDIMLLLTITLLVVCWKRLLPYGEYRKRFKPMEVFT